MVLYTFAISGTARILADGLAPHPHAPPRPKKTPQPTNGYFTHETDQFQRTKIHHSIPEQLVAGHYSCISQDTAVNIPAHAAFPTPA